LASFFNEDPSISFQGGGDDAPNWARPARLELVGIYNSIKRMRTYDSFAA
jgi:hypothetical protein